MPTRLSALLATLALMLVAAGSTTSPPATLVSFDALQKRIATPDPRLRLLDTRPRLEFDKGHIPGAVWVDMKAAAAIATKPNGLTDKDAWSAWLAPLAIGEDSEVLVIDGARQLDAARAWWLLKYLGVGEVGLIDGNYPLWAKEGRPVSTDSTKVDPRPFRVTFRTDRHATRSEVLAALEAHTARVIDARTEAEHTGAQAKAKRGGHIPTACHLEWTEFVTPDGRFLDEPATRAKLIAAGLKPGEPLITHCQSGGRASVDAFVFERLGFPTRNYYLGWSDWGNVEDTPVATGKESGPKKP
jgi:thiosulfate/3-mercaptopyruvate sulfurtransferase